MAKLIVGCGYVGYRVAQAWMTRGETVFAVTRSRETAHKFATAGIQPLLADVTQPDSLPEFPPCETVLFAVGFDRSARYPIREVYVDGLTHVLQRLPESTGRLVYLSSTGVYGQADGAWVDEDSPCHPTRDGGWACLMAEGRLRASRFGQKAVILRLAGIYGPGRVPRRSELMEGKPMAAATNGYLNLIHVDDVVKTILVAADARQPASCYVVSDGNPVLRQLYYQEICRRLGVDCPEFVPPTAGSAAASRAAGDKRIRSDRFRAELGVELEFPDYRSGLASIISREESVR